MAEKKEKQELERVYTVPLRAAFRDSPKYRRANRAVKALQEFLKKHMKATDVKLGQHVNNLLWQHGIKNPPPRVTVKAVRDAEGVVRAELEGKAYKESVKPLPKEEAQGLKEKLVDKIAGKEKPEAAETEEKPVKEKAAEKKAAPKADEKTLKQE